MGCHDQACAVSRLPISYMRGNKCYILPISKNEYSSLNNGPFYEYSPFCLPIEGEYDDYGRIENIVKNHHTKYLENYFGLSIENIVKCLCDGRKNHGIEYNQFGSLMEALGCNFSKISKKNLLKMGFTVSDDNIVDHEIIVNNVKLNNGEFDTEHYKTDVSKSWMGVEKDVKYVLKKVDSYHEYVVEMIVNDKIVDTLEDISKLCKSFSNRRKNLKKNQRQSIYSNDTFVFGANIEKDVQDKMLILHNTTVCFIKKEIYDEYSKLAESEIDEWRKKRLEESVDILTGVNEKMIAAEEYMKAWHKKSDDERKEDRETEEQKNEWHKNYTLSDPSNVKRNCYLIGVFGEYRNIYFDNEIKFDEAFLPDFVKFSHFITSLYSTNSIIYPWFNLEQHGNRTDFLKYMKISEKIIKKEIKQENY